MYKTRNAFIQARLRKSDRKHARITSHYPRVSWARQGFFVSGWDEQDFGETEKGKYPPQKYDWQDRHKLPVVYDWWCNAGVSHHAVWNGITAEYEGINFYSRATLQSNVCFNLLFCSCHRKQAHFRWKKPFIVPPKELWWVQKVIAVSPEINIPCCQVHPLRKQIFRTYTCQF